MARSSRPSAKAAQLDLVRSGEATVKVHRPHDPALPGDLRWGWNDYTDADGNRRPQFLLQSNPDQQVRVSYQVHTDPLMLRDLEQRANTNQSGTAVRGLGHARAGQKATVDLSPRIVESLVKRAANLATHRTAEGPVKVSVKLLQEPDGFAPICQRCKRTVAEHQVAAVAKTGDWTEPDAQGRREWDNDKPRIDRHWLCPQ